MIDNKENIRVSMGTYVKPMYQPIQNDSLSLIEKVSGKLKKKKKLIHWTQEYRQG